MTMEKIKVVADFDWLENEETIGLLGHESQRGTDVLIHDADYLKIILDVYFRRSGKILNDRTTMAGAQC